MGKAIFWIVIFIGGLFATRILARKAVKHAMDAQQAFDQTQSNKPIPITEKMVRCDYCGVHHPSSESISMENKTWCSKEHARLGAKQQA